MFDFDEDSCNQCAIEEDIIIAEPAPLESTVATRQGRALVGFHGD